MDLSSNALGAIPAGTVDLASEVLLHDGVAPIGSGLSVSSPLLPLELTVDLAGTGACPVAGLIINNQATSGSPQDQMRGFEFQLSSDGVTFETVLTGEVSSLASDQSFVLDAPINATHARLAITSSYSDNPLAPYYLSLGEWSVIGQPGFVPDTVAQINVADWAYGGHIVRSDPQLASPDFAISMLTADGLWQSISAGDASRISWVVGFAEDRAALLTDMGWVDAVETDPAQQMRSVDIEISMGSATGPWESIGTWDLERNSDGTIDGFDFDEPTWARYVRFSGDVNPEQYVAEVPEQLIIHEQLISDEYLSVIGTWGSVNANGFYEFLNPPVSLAVSDEQDAPDDSANATELQLGETISGRAQIGKDIDWYRVTAPRGDNQLSFTLTGVPTVDVTVRLYDTSGQEIAAQREISGNTSTVIYTATVDPGAEYLVKVEQPPHSIVFAFDTSASMGNYQPLVQQSLRSFAGGIEKGQEFVNVMAFDEEPLLETWTDDSYVVYSAINGYYDLSLSSSAETGILDSTEPVGWAGRHHRDSDHHRRRNQQLDRKLQDVGRAGFGAAADICGACWWGGNSGVERAPYAKLVEPGWVLPIHCEPI